MTIVHIDLPKKQKINQNNICSVLFTYAAFAMFFAPYNHDVLGSDFIRQAIRISLYVIAILTGFIIAIRKRKVSIVILVSIIYFLMHNFWTSKYASNSKEICTTLLLMAFLAAGKKIWKQVFYYYRKVLIILAFIACIIYFAYVLSLPIPYKVNPYYHMSYDWMKAYYINYGICYLCQTGVYVRLCSIFDEPGLFGTICALVLCADNINLKNRKNWILITAGALSFSLAFIVILFLYLMFLSVRNIKTFIVLLAIILLYFFVLPNVETNNPSVNKLLERIVITSEGLAGDNRSNDTLDNMFTETLKNNALFGQGRGYAHYFADAASYKILLIDYGIIGFCILIGALAVSALQYTKKRYDMKAFVLCFLISIYQRPNVFALPYFIVLYGGLMWMENKTKKELYMINKAFKMKGRKFLI